MPRLLIPGARALALLSLLALSGCSRAEKPQAAAPAPTPAAEAATNAPPVNATVVTNDTTLLAAAPHPTEGTNNPDAVIHSPVPAPGAALRVLVPEGQNPPWLAETLAKAAGAKVEIKTYATHAEAVAAASGEAPPELASLSDRAAAELMAKNGLQPLGDAAKGIPAPAPEFVHHYFDPKSAYTWPYGFTLLGIGTVAPADPKAFVPRTWHDLARIDLALSMPSDPALKGALWALAEAKPALTDVPPEAWRNAPYEASPAAPAPGKAWVDTMARLRLVHADRFAAAVPAEGSIVFLYHWTFPGTAAPTPAAVAALRALADPASAARFDAEAGLAVTQPAAKTAGPADLATSFLPHALNESRFVHPTAAAATAAPGAEAPAVAAPAPAPAK